MKEKMGWGEGGAWSDSRTWPTGPINPTKSVPHKMVLLYGTALQLLDIIDISAKAVNVDCATIPGHRSTPCFDHHSPRFPRGFPASGHARGLALPVLSPCPIAFCHVPPYHVLPVPPLRVSLKRPHIPSYPCPDHSCQVVRYFLPC